MTEPTPPNAATTAPLPRQPEHLPAPSEHLQAPPHQPAEQVASSAAPGWEPTARDPFTDLFAPPGEAWQRLSPQYPRLKRLMVVLVWGMWSVLTVVIVGLTWRWWAAGVLAVVALCWIGYRFWRIATVCAAWGYAERDTDLYVRHGVWMRRLVAVPYGRMQMVEVNSGPIERRFGLATVRLVTASARTNAEIPGLAAEDAAVLRDRLAERGEHQSMGL